MNFKAIGLNTLMEYSEQNTDYTLGEIIYSFLREPVSGIKNTKDILKLTDEEVYTIIEKAKNIEKA